MLLNLALGLLVMVMCLLVQSMIVVVCVEYYARRGEWLDSPSIGSTLRLISAVMTLLVLGNFLQIAIWGGLFMYLGEFRDFTTAAYHSAVNFATLGYGDIVMSEEHRILGPMQAVNGVLMIGVSTAVVMSALQNALRRTYQARQD